MVTMKSNKRAGSVPSCIHKRARAEEEEEERYTSSFFQNDSESDLSSESCEIESFLVQTPSVDDEEGEHSTSLVVRVCSEDFYLDDITQFSLVEESPYFRSLINTTSTSVVEGEEPVVIQIPAKVPLTPFIFQTVLNFCSHQLMEGEICGENVVNLIIASEFLEMKSLTCIASKFLEDIALSAWEGCLTVLSTFEVRYLPKVEPKYLPKVSGYHLAKSRGKIVPDSEPSQDEILSMSLTRSLFEMSKTAFLGKIAEFPSESGSPLHMCDIICVLQVANLLPLRTAELILGSLLAEQLGLFYMNDEISLNLYDHVPLPGSDVDDIAEGISTGLTVDTPQGPSLIYSYVQVLFYNGRYTLIDGLMKEVRKILPDVWKRSLFILYLIRLIRFQEKDRNVMIVVCFHFLSALLVETTELMPTLRPEGHEHLQTIERSLREEIGNLERLVVSFFRIGQSEDTCGPALFSGQHEIQPLMAKFSSFNLLSIVDKLGNFKNKERFVGVANVFDTCLLGHLNDNSFTVQQVIDIYKSFPNYNRPTHVEIYNVFKDYLGRNNPTRKISTDISRIFDYKKLPDDVVELLWVKFGAGCPHTQLHERVIEMQQRKIEEAENEHIRLRAELDDIKLELKLTDDCKRQVESELLRLRNEVRERTFRLDSIVDDSFMQSEFELLEMYA